MTIFDGGYQSKTTKSRLNVLCNEYCIKGEGVFQKNYQWFVRKFVGAINGQNVYKTEEFHSSYLFAWLPYLILTSWNFFSLLSSVFCSGNQLTQDNSLLIHYNMLVKSLNQMKTKNWQSVKRLIVSWTNSTRYLSLCLINKWTLKQTKSLTVMNSNKT